IAVDERLAGGELDLETALAEARHLELTIASEVEAFGELVGGGVHEGGAVVLLDLDQALGDDEPELGVTATGNGGLTYEDHDLILERQQVDSDGLIAEDDTVVIAEELDALDGDPCVLEIAGGIREHDGHGTGVARGL